MRCRDKQADTRVFMKYKTTNKCAMLINMRKFNGKIAYKAQPRKLPSLEKPRSFLRGMPGAAMAFEWEPENQIRGSLKVFCMMATPKMLLLYWQLAVSIRLSPLTTTISVSRGAAYSNLDTQPGVKTFGPRGGRC